MTVTQWAKKLRLRRRNPSNPGGHLDHMCLRRWCCCTTQCRWGVNARKPHSRHSHRFCNIQSSRNLVAAHGSRGKNPPCSVWFLGGFGESIPFGYSNQVLIKAQSPFKPCLTTFVMIYWWTVCIWLSYCRESSMQHSLEIEVAQVLLIPYGNHWSYGFIAKESRSDFGRRRAEWNNHYHIHVVSSVPMCVGHQFSFVSCASFSTHLVAKAFVSSIVQLQKTKHFDILIMIKMRPQYFMIFHE